MSELQSLEVRVANLESEVRLLKELLQQKPAEVAKPVVAVAEPTVIKASDDFEVCRNLLMSEHWPAAVDPTLICNTTSEQDKEDRAEGILDLIIDVHLENLSFLDFGCGEGHVVNKSVRQSPKVSVGYDIVESPRWSEWPMSEKMMFTIDWSEVVKHGPYNVILMYDVLDHIQGDTNTVVENLRKIRNVTAPNAKVFVRCHPWCSRHGTHLYHTINKAYMHLVFTEEELQLMGYNQMYTREVIHPIATYNNWFRMAGFHTLIKEQVTRETVEKFFQNNAPVAKRIKSRWKKSHERELRDGVKLPLLQMELQFVDYVLG